MQLAMSALREAHAFSDQTILDLIMGQAIQYFGLKKRSVVLIEG